MKDKYLLSVFLLLPLSGFCQIWDTYGLDSISMECREFKHITVYNETIWTGSLVLAGTIIEKAETPSMLFVCDLSKSDADGKLWLIGSIPPDIWTTHGNAFVVYKFDGTEWFEVSPPPSFGYAQCTSIAFEDNGKVWFTTSSKGAFMFDGTTWQQFLKNNVFDGANSMVIDQDGKKWFATLNGIVIYDGDNFTVLNNSNSGLKCNVINDIAIDADGKLWLASGLPNCNDEETTGSIVTFDGINWTYYNPFKSNNTVNYAYTIAIDQEGKIWAGTRMGLTVFDGINWINHIESHSFAEVLQVLAIDFDANGNKWFGTTCGILKLQGNLSTEISDFPNMRAKLSPNPVADKLHIWSPEGNGIGDVTIIGSDGNIYIRERTSLDETHIALEELSPGTYIIKVNYANFTIIEKFIKN